MFIRVPFRERGGDRGVFRAIAPHRVPFRVTPGGPEHTIELPQRYRDWSLMLGHFPASAAALGRLLPADSGLVPVTVAPGIGIVKWDAIELKSFTPVKD